MAKCSKCGKEYEAGTGAMAKCPLCWTQERDALIEDNLKKVRARQRDRFKMECNIPYLFWDKTFYNFKREEQPLAYDRVFKWQHYPDDEKDYEDYRTTTALLLLSPGVYGVGKTHLVASYINRMIADDGRLASIGKSGAINIWDCPAYFITEPKLLARIRATFSEDAEESEEDVYYELTRKYDYLAIDDIGKVKPRDYSFLQSVYFRLIDTIYTRDDRYIILTTNLDFEELENHLGGATSDRLVEMCGDNIIKMTGKSYRTKIKQ